MILSKGSLRAVEVSSTSVAVLDNVFIGKDGTVVASSQKTIIAVSPMAPGARANVPLEETEMTQDVTISAKTIREVLKTIPKDNTFGGQLEHCDVEVKEDKTVHFTAKDGQRTRVIQARPYPREYIPFKELIGEALVNAAKKGNQGRVVLNRKRLAELLKTLDNVCPDPSGESAVFLEFDNENNVLLRAVNPTTDQRAIALMASYKGAEGQWPSLTKWEQSMLMVGAKARREREKQNA